MEIRRLTEAAYKATFAYRMHDVSGSARPTIDVDPYLDQIPADDLEGFELVSDGVRQVYRDAHDRYEHVLFPLDPSDTCLVIVLDLRNTWVHGHFLLHLGNTSSRTRP